MRFLLLALALPLFGQTGIDVSQIKATTSDAILLNFSGTPSIIRAQLCQDRTGATCPAGALYVTTAGQLRAVPAPAPAGQRYKCQTPVVPTASAPTATLQITEAGFVAESLMVYLNGLLMSGATVGAVQGDYGRIGQTITLNRPVDQQTVLQVCYSY